MEGLAYRIWAKRRALIAAVLVPFAIHLLSAWAVGVGVPGFWMAIAGLAYGAVASTIIVSWPALLIPLLPFAAAAAALAGAAPWLDAGGSLGFGLSRAVSLTIICVLSMALSIALGFLRLKGPLEFVARQNIAAPSDRVFEQMRAEEQRRPRQVEHHLPEKPDQGPLLRRSRDHLMPEEGQ
ncbi:MAG: hypothetical protein AAFU55_13160 [Pseudomonadota bacterium]